MLIGVSGSHCSGKSSLIDEFCERHPEFSRVAEPYEELDEVWSEISTEVLLDQLEFQIEQLRSMLGDNVIVERTPLDFVAYLQALNDLGRGSFDVARCFDAAMDATRRFDLIAFLPTDGASIYVPVEEDRELRSTVNDRLRDLVIESDVGVLTVELIGPTRQRVEMLENVLKQSPVVPR